MKKFLCILIVAIVAVILTGCKKETKREHGSSTNQNKIVVTLSESVDNEYINSIDVGYDVNGDDVIKIEYDDSDKQNCDMINSTACKYDKKYTITGKKEGRRQVIFTEAVFDKSDKSYIIKKQTLYDIVVDNDLKITETHISGNDYEKVYYFDFEKRSVATPNCKSRISFSDKSIIKIDDYKFETKCKDEKYCGWTWVLFAKGIKEGETEAIFYLDCNGKNAFSGNSSYSVNKKLKIRKY